MEDMGDVTRLDEHQVVQAKRAEVRPRRESRSAAELRRQIFLRYSDLLLDVVRTAQGVKTPGIPDPTPRQVFNARMKLLDKVMPDLKAMELSGEDGGPVSVEVVDARDRLARIVSGLIGAAESGEGDKES